MADIVYNRNFQHADWVDQEDVVQAGGPTGFNKKFHDLEDEFDKISQVVLKINTALASLGQQVGAPVTIGLTPMLLPWGTTPSWEAITWSRVEQPGNKKMGTFVEKAVNNAQAWGVMPLSVPNGVTLVSFKVLGEQQGGGEATTDLYQELRADPFDRISLLQIKGLADSVSAPTPFPAGVIFDGANKLYYILVRAINAANATIRLRGFQITYKD